MDLLEAPKKLPGDTAPEAPVGWAAAAGGAPATVTPVTRANDAGMDERPGVMEAAAVTAAAAPPPKARPVGGGPQKHPGGAFCH
jgi:hypothetical protein